MPYKDLETSRKYQAAYRARRREHRAKIHVAWRQRNRAAWDRYQAEYRKQNRDLLRQRSRAAYRKNRARYFEKNRAWKKAHPEWMAAFYHKRRDNNLERGRRNYQRNRTYRLQKAKEYALRNPHAGVKRNAVRRLRIEATIENEHAIEYFVKLIRTSSHVACYYCGERVPGRKAHIEHVVPLARGGKHAPENLCASCRPCNLEKHAKLISEWKRAGQQLLAL